MTSILCGRGVARATGKIPAMSEATALDLEAAGDDDAATARMIERARELARAQRWQEASRAYQAAAVRLGDDPALAADYGAALYKARRYEDSLKPLSAAVLANPGDQKSAHRLAMAVQQLGQAWPEPAPTGPHRPEGMLPPAGAAADPAAILADLAGRVGNERMSGRLAPSSFPFLEHGYPEIDYASHPGYGRAADLVIGDEGDTVRPLYEAFAPIWNGYLAMQEQVQPLAAPTGHAGAFRTLERDGILVLKMADAERAELLARTEPAAVEVRRRRATMPPRSRGVEASSGSLYHAKSNQTDFVDFLERVFEAHGILAMASAYQGLPMSIKLANLQINSAEDSSIIGNSTVGDLPLSPGYYLHIDSSLGVMKVIIYRSRVTAAMGAFRYIPGSNRIGVTPFELCLRKATDKSNYDSCKTKDRRKFACLPAFLQKKANFGNDLLPGHPDLEPLLAQERTMAGEPGDMLVFDNNGIHRGAIFETGEREIIQVLLAP